MSQIFDQLGRLSLGGWLDLIGAMIVIGVAACIAPRLIRMFKHRPPPSPVAKPFLTNRKHAMFAALERVLPMYRIHAQVAMSALLAPDTKQGRRPRSSDGESFARLVVDFVIVDPVSSAVVALVEMDDRFAEPHQDDARDAMTARAGYKTIRIASSDRATISTAQAAVGHLRDAALEASPAVTRLPVATTVWPLEGRFNGAQ